MYMYLEKAVTTSQEAEIPLLVGNLGRYGRRHKLSQP